VAPAFAKDLANRSGSKLKEKMASKGKQASAKSPSFFKKVLEGANSKGGIKNWKPGSLRSIMETLA
jgi:hypothetical protein